VLTATGSIAQLAGSIARDVIEYSVPLTLRAANATFTVAVERHWRDLWI
jgi:hypothetical protein